MAAGRRESAGTDLVLFETLTEVTAELLDIQPLRSAVEAILTWEPTRKPRVVKTPSLEALNASKLLSRSGADYCSALVELDRDEDGGRFIWVVKSRYSVSVSGRLSFEMSGDGTQLVRDDRSGAVAGAALQTAASTPQAELSVQTTPCPTTVRSEPAPVAAARAEEQRRILVIDDESEAREQLQSWLGEDHDVTTVDSGLQAISEVTANPPHLIDAAVHNGAAPRTVPTSRAMDAITTGMVNGLTTALLLITGVLAVALLSPRPAIVALAPNLLPLVIVGGTMGWPGVPLSF